MLLPTIINKSLVILELKFILICYTQSDKVFESLPDYKSTSVFFLQQDSATTGSLFNSLF